MQGKVKVPEGKKQIACIGDSITYGHGVNGRTKLTWEYFLNGMTGGKYQVLNFGVNGRTLMSSGDCPYVSDMIYRRTLECKADIYLIMLGTNDAGKDSWDGDRFKREYASFLKTYMDLPHRPKVVAMIPPHVFPMSDGTVGYGVDLDIYDNQTVKMIREIAEGMGLQIIDLYSFTEGHPEWFMDGVHPNEEGNRAIAGFLYRELGL